MPCDFFPDIENTGIYLHIPFCAKKCRYCDFYSLPETNRIDAFVTALLTEIRLTGPRIPGQLHDNPDCEPCRAAG